MRVSPLSPLSPLSLLSLLSLAGSVSPEPGRVSQLVTDFGLRLFRAALGARGDTNAAFAPLGATSVLVALQVATAGSGRRQLEAASGLSMDAPGVAAELRALLGSLRAGGERRGLAVAQGLFVARGVALRPRFVARLLRALGPRSLGRLELGNGEGASRALNAWARERTRGETPGAGGRAGVPRGGGRRHAPAGGRRRVLPGVLGGPVRRRGRAAAPVPARGRRRGDGDDGGGGGARALRPVRVPGRCPLHGDRAAVRGGGEVALLLVAPEQRHVPIVTLRPLLRAATVTGWVTALSPAPPRVVVLPRFSIDSSWDLRGPLQSLGVRDLFDPQRAEFSPATAEPLVLGQVLQRVRMEVTENGTEVASASAAVVYSRMAPPEIVLDHPFLFLVRHHPTATPPGEEAPPTRKGGHTAPREKSCPLEKETTPPGEKPHLPRREATLPGEEFRPPERRPRPSRKRLRPRGAAPPTGEKATFPGWKPRPPWKRPRLLVRKPRPLAGEAPHIGEEATPSGREAPPTHKIDHASPEISHAHRGGSHAPGEATPIQKTPPTGVEATPPGRSPAHKAAQGASTARVAALMTQGWLQYRLCPQGGSTDDSAVAAVPAVPTGWQH
ncbi:plasminogen activator inhibitor 1-like [Oenanthe melanoleuca]|uniref:plasminogen activator inhibitor 1-like n=1 Tax=Oenanthe melanoleuca TaxID=2939378 RepID=UPI0024C14FF8|nr:plasminogen activator inhibitor 1-like [Oenanthe melanoleuca]